MIDIGHLHQVATRLQNVQLECRDALKVIKTYDNDDALIYFDPPYLHSTRVNKDFYPYEVEAEFHKAAAGLLKQCRGFVVVSGYPSPEYRDWYELEGWVRFERSAVCNAGARRTECIWVSPHTIKALNRPKEPKEVELFS